MQALTSEWVTKAEGDFVTSQRELRARVLPNYDAVCFHAAQCAEKYLKARLQEANIVFPRTYDIAALLALTLTVEPAWSTLMADARLLSALSVDVRYPGTTADKQLARDTFKASSRVRQAVRQSLHI